MKWDYITCVTLLALKKNCISLSSEGKMGDLTIFKPHSEKE